ncbi:hypothetical protein ACE1SV_71380 [Streptomyces sennicomposti]
MRAAVAHRRPHRHTEPESHGALGHGPVQAPDRNWKVCSQNVPAGTPVPTDTALDSGSVEPGETCPAQDDTEPTAAGGKPPDVKGRSTKAARAALDSGTSITVQNASAQDRWVLVESNRQGCRPRRPVPR